MSLLADLRRGYASVQDWHATILHLLGMDHQGLIFDRVGLEEKLTHVFDAQVINGILA